MVVLGFAEVPTTSYFREQVLRKRTYLQIEWCIAVLHNHYRSETQPDGRVRFWGYVPELEGKALRVVTLEDRTTLHNAFPDSVEPRLPFMKLHYYEETDSLYIDLSDSMSASSREVSQDFVVDYDEAGQVVGFDIQHASRHLDLSRVETTHLPIPAAAS